MKKLISIILIVFLSLSCNFAKPNPNAKTYKTYETTDKNAPVVYFIRDITPESLVKIYEALGFKATGKVGVKISTGESNKSNHLRPELIGDLVKKYGGGTIVECNTAYGGSRSSNAKHKRAFKDRGYDKIAKFDLLDEEGDMTIPVTGGIRLKEDYVGTHFANYDSYIILSHFKGHSMAGFGGTMFHQLGASPGPRFLLDLEAAHQQKNPARRSFIPVEKASRVCGVENRTSSPRRWRKHRKQFAITWRKRAECVTSM